MFRGRLFAGKLYAGRLFGAQQEVTPQATLPLEYHGGGDLIDRVLDKWRTIEEARAKRSAKRPAIVEVVDQSFAIAPQPVEEEVAASLRESRIANDTQSGVPPTHPGLVIQPTYEFKPRQEPVRVAPTKALPATVQAAVDDGLEDMMAVLLALDEAGEL